MHYWQFKNGTRLNFSPLEDGGEYELKVIKMEQETKIIEQTAVAVFNPVKEAINQLRAEYGDRVYDVTGYSGMSEAKKARAEVRKWRTSLERARKDEKAQYLAAGRLLDSTAKELTAELLAIEGPIDSLIKAEEAKKEEERRLREEAEARRVAKIVGAITKIAETPSRFFRESSEELSGELAKLDGHDDAVFAGSFEEFADQARETIAKAKDEMNVLLQSAVSAEAEAERVAAERAANEAKEAELAKEREELSKAKAEAEAEKAAAAAKIAEAEAEIAAEREKLAQEKRDAVAAKLKAEEAEKDRISDIKARMQRMKEIAAQFENSTVEEISESLAYVRETKPNDMFGEFQEAAVGIWEKTIKDLEGYLVSASAKEAKEKEEPAKDTRHVYESQNDALVAIYQICYSGLTDDCDSVTEIGLIAKANMEVG